MADGDASSDTLPPLHRLLRALVRRPSVNPMGSPDRHADFAYEFRVARFVARWARRRQIDCTVSLVAPQRYNVLLRYANPASTRTVLLEVHQDTVPVDGMTVAAFAGHIEGGRLYGRGACDVKGGMAAMLSVLDRLQREKPATAANVVLACTVDEEYGNTGIRELVRCGVRADMAVCAEPTNLQIVDAHKGVTGWRVRVPGRAVHSSRPGDGVSAIYRMGHLLGAVERYAEHLERTASDPRLGGPTVSVGKIRGGVSVNTVPDSCVIDIDRRLLPGERAEEAEADFNRYLAQSPGIDFPFAIESLKQSIPALVSQGNAELLRRLGAAIDSVSGSHGVHAVPFGTDASTIAEAGIPCVVFGPGNIAQAHTPDEWIELEQVDRAAEILYRFVTQAE